MPIKFLLLGGGVGFFLEGGGGSANFNFMGVGIFPKKYNIPHCGLAPEKMKRCRKNAKVVIFGAIFASFSVFF